MYQSESNVCYFMATIILSDLSVFLRVMRHTTDISKRSDERFNSESLSTTVKHGGDAIMVSGCFLYQPLVSSYVKSPII